LSDDDIDGLTRKVVDSITTKRDTFKGEQEYVLYLEEILRSATRNVLLADASVLSNNKRLRDIVEQLINLFNGMIQSLGVFQELVKKVRHDSQRVEELSEATSTLEELVVRIESDHEGLRRGFDKLHDIHNELKEKHQRLLITHLEVISGKKREGNPWQAMTDQQRETFRRLVQKVNCFETGLKKGELNFTALSKECRKVFPKGINGRQLDDKFVKELCELAGLK
jgi:DNA repair ATPase RecN